MGYYKHVRNAIRRLSKPLVKFALYCALCIAFFAGKMSACVSVQIESIGKTACFVV